MNPVYRAAALLSMLLVSACGDSGSAAPADTDGSSADTTADAIDEGSAADSTDGSAADTVDEGSETPLPPFPPETFTTEQALDAVRSFVGSGGTGFGYAGLTPAAQLPNGMVKLGPDTTNGPYHPSQSHFSGYNFTDPHIRGFSHTRFVGTGATDFCNLRILPVASLNDKLPAARWATFDKASESASPGYYAVNLTEPAVRVENTVTLRSGFTRVSSLDGQPFSLLFDAASHVEDSPVESSEVTVDPATGAFSGMVHFTGGFAGRAGGVHLYFTGTVDQPVAAASVWDEAGYREGSSASGLQSGVVLAFAAGTAPVTVRVALSFVDAAGATGNFAAEAADLSFDEAKAAARAAWGSKLALVQMGTEDEATAQTFYTALYNTYRMPTRYDDADHRYTGVDELPHQGSAKGYYSDLSLWDTFRTLHPWYLMVDPELQRTSLASLITMGEQGGYVPRWPSVLGDTGSMVGTSADFLFSESLQKGLDGIDYNHALDLLNITADVPVGGSQQLRDNITDYLSYGYIPSDLGNESVSQTQEFAYADHALFRLAQALGRVDEAERFATRAGYHKNLFDAETGFYQPKRADGTFDRVARRESFFMGGGPYTEGTIWHYRFYAPHDVSGMVDLFGGAEPFGAALEEFFSRSALGRAARPNNVLPDSYYWHGNEPDLHTAWLFYASADPSRRYHWLRQIQTRLYGNGPDGLPGNDDGGTLSAWYLFAAVGLFPIAGTDTFILGNPIVPLATLPLVGGEGLRIEAPGASPTRGFVASTTLNGAPYTEPTITYAQLRGATLRFEMTNAP